MSKSVGNVVDPLVVIDEIGTDPLRFTLATGTTPGQDLNLSMDRLRSNRNFVNKIWNGGKFILFNLAETEQAEVGCKIQKPTPHVANEANVPGAMSSKRTTPDNADAQSRCQTPNVNARWWGLAL